MAKVTATLSVRGTDLGELVSSARAQLAEFSDATFAVTAIDLYPCDDIATKQGMTPLFSASITFEANVKL